MYKVIIVDDEAIIRKGIKNIIHWKRLGCEICGEAKEGISGAKLIEEVKPDIIITDINMPEVDGLTMIKNTKDLLPHCKIIILTGYRDFEYMQQAISLGAFEYILKPSKIEVITSIIHKAVKELDSMRSYEKELERVKKEFEKKLPILRQKLLYDIMFMPGYNALEVEEELSFYELKIDRFVIMALETDEDNTDEFNNQYSKRLYQFGVINSFEDIVEEKFSIQSIPVNNNLVVLLISIIENSEEAFKTLCEYASNLQELVSSCFNFTVTAAFSTIGNGPLELSEKAKEAIDALEYKFYMGKNSMIFFQDLKGLYKTLDSEPMEEYEKQLVQSIKLGNENNVESILNSIKEELNASGTNKESIKKFYWKAINKIYTIPLEMKIDLKKSKEKDIMDTFLAIEGCKNIEELSEILKEAALETTRIINNLNRRAMNETLQRALDFIKENYKEQITLNHVAENTFVSTYYLSRMFTKELGKNFVDYLNEVRVEKAKEYLKDTNYRTYEIAELVGIKDAHYFSKIFKKYTGTTPSEYKAK